MSEKESCKSFVKGTILDTFIMERSPSTEVILVDNLENQILTPLSSSIMLTACNKEGECVLIMTCRKDVPGESRSIDKSLSNLTMELMRKGCIPYNTNPINPTESYEMISENYSYRCLIDGNEVPPTFKIDEEGMPIESIVKLEISKKKADKYKTFWLVLNSVYIIHNDIRSDRLYEFDYRFILPSLFGEKENSLKVVTKAKHLGNKIYEKVSFNGKEISHNNGNVFDIAISNI